MKQSTRINKKNVEGLAQKARAGLVAVAGDVLAQVEKAGVPEGVYTRVDETALLQNRVRVVSAGAGVQRLYFYPQAPGGGWFEPWIKGTQAGSAQKLFAGAIKK